MPSIAFWNVQRSRGYNTGDSDSGVTVGEDVAGIAEGCSPDAIVLCELLKGFAKAGGLSAPDGYRFVVPDNHLCDYHSDSTLRYGVMVRATRSYTCLLIPTVANDSSTRKDVRPAVGLILEGSHGVIALHASARSTHHRYKIRQAAFAAEGLRKYMSGAKLDVIVGDFNINLVDTSTAAVNNTVDEEEALKGFRVRATRGGTHSKASDGGAFVGTLDWALLSPETLGSATIRLIQPAAPQSTNSSRQLLRLQFENQKASDHLPITVTW